MSKKLNITQKTAWFLSHKIREADAREIEKSKEKLKSKERSQRICHKTLTYKETIK